MSVYKRILKPVRMDKETVESVPELIQRLGLHETFSDFVRVAMDERVRKLKAMPVEVAQP